MVKFLLTLTLALSFTVVSACQTNRSESKNMQTNAAPKNSAAELTSEQRVTVESSDGLKLVGTFTQLKSQIHPPFCFCISGRATVIPMMTLPSG